MGDPGSIPIQGDIKMRTGSKRHGPQLLTLWNKADSELGFSTIECEGKTKMGLTKRTIINYLNVLLGRKIIKKMGETKGLGINKNPLYCIYYTCR